MRKSALALLCAAAGVLWTSTAFSQSATIAPTANQSHGSYRANGAVVPMTKIRKPVSRAGAPTDPSWLRQMRDPCQVEG
jgi:hypothetical protein